MKEEYANYLIQKTKEDYDKIAYDFDRTRAYLWDDLRQFTSYVKEGDSVLDFGCGNGRLFELFRDIKNIRYAGVDQSEKLIDLARAKYPAGEFLCVEGFRLPFPDSSFDAVFAVAVLHHIPSAKKRKKLLAEFRRVLKPGGTLIITVWNLWQKKYRSLILKYTIGKIVGQSELDFGDVLVPWLNERGEKIAERYYHAFTAHSLNQVIQNGGFVIHKTGYFGGAAKKFNIYVIARK